MMTQIDPYSQEMADTITGCHTCPMGRHLNGTRFACADRFRTTDSRHAPTQECRQAVVDSPHKYFQPLPLTDFKGINPEQVCSHVGVIVDWLDVDEDQTPDGADLIVVKFQGSTIASIKKKGDLYYCDRVTGVLSLDPYSVALQTIHPDYLFGVVEDILANQIAVDYN
jgi:hypothetical protein